MCLCTRDRAIVRAVGVGGLLVSYLLLRGIVECVQVCEVSSSMSQWPSGLEMVI